MNGDIARRTARAAAQIKRFGVINGDVTGDRPINHDRTHCRVVAHIVCHGHRTGRRIQRVIITGTCRAGAIDRVAEGKHPIISADNSRIKHGIAAANKHGARKAYHGTRIVAVVIYLKGTSKRIGTTSCAAAQRGSAGVAVNQRRNPNALPISYHIVRKGHTTGTRERQRRSTRSPTIYHTHRFIKGKQARRIGAGIDGQGCIDTHRAVKGNRTIIGSIIIRGGDVAIQRNHPGKTTTVAARRRGRGRARPQGIGSARR